MADILKRRLERAMDDAADVAEDLADDRGVALPPEFVGQMGLSLFQARVAVLTSDSNQFDFPEDDGRGMH